MLPNSDGKLHKVKEGLLAGKIKDMQLSKL